MYNGIINIRPRVCALLHRNFSLRQIYAPPHINAASLTFLSLTITASNRYESFTLRRTSIYSTGRLSSLRRCWLTQYSKFSLQSRARQQPRSTLLAWFHVVARHRLFLLLNNTTSCSYLYGCVLYVFGWVAHQSNLTACFTVSH